MSISFTLPMHAARGTVQLGDVLQRIDGRWQHWRIFEFYGIGEMPGGLPVQEFETKAMSTPGGILLDRTGVVDFARRAQRVFDLLLVAVDSPIEPLHLAEDVDSHIAEYPLVIEAFDSSTWTITTTLDGFDLTRLHELLDP